MIRPFTIVDVPLVVGETSTENPRDCEDDDYKSNDNAITECDNNPSSNGKNDDKDDKDDSKSDDTATLSKRKREPVKRKEQEKKRKKNDKKQDAIKQNVPPPPSEHLREKINKFLDKKDDEIVEEINLDEMVSCVTGRAVNRWNNKAILRSKLSTRFTALYNVAKANWMPTTNSTMIKSIVESLLSVHKGDNIGNAKMMNWVHHFYSVVNVQSKDSKDGTELLYDVIFTLTKMNYIVFHETIDASGDTKSLAHETMISYELERQHLTQCLVAAGQRRAFKELITEIVDVQCLPKTEACFLCSQEYIKWFCCFLYRLQQTSSQSCIKVAFDFVSPENVGDCIRLSEESRLLLPNHRFKEHKLEVKKMTLYAISGALKELGDDTGDDSRDNTEINKRAIGYPPLPPQNGDIQDDLDDAPPVNPMFERGTGKNTRAVVESPSRAHHSTPKHTHVFFDDDGEPDLIDITNTVFATPLLCNLGFVRAPDPSPEVIPEQTFSSEPVVAPSADKPQPASLLVDDNTATYDVVLENPSIPSPPMDKGKTSDDSEDDEEPSISRPPSPLKFFALAKKKVSSLKTPEYRLNVSLPPYALLLSGAFQVGPLMTPKCT
ncbi:hypothetical protein ACFE04_023145 [Oxalis oulophora]